MVAKYRKTELLKLKFLLNSVKKYENIKNVLIEDIFCSCILNNKNFVEDGTKRNAPMNCCIQQALVPWQAGNQYT